MRMTNRQRSNTSLNPQLAASQQATPSLDDVIEAGRLAWQWWQLTKDLEAELDIGTHSHRPDPAAKEPTGSCCERDGRRTSPGTGSAPGTRSSLDVGQCSGGIAVFGGGPVEGGHDRRGGDPRVR
jgi:hypothetical protein